MTVKQAISELQKCPLDSKLVVTKEVGELSIPVETIIDTLDGKVVIQDEAIVLELKCDLDWAER